jgi:ketosteroid isomerase-like protein
MAESGSGIGDKVSDAVERVKHAVSGESGESDDREREDNVEGRVSVVREALRALGDGDVDRFLEAFSEDVEWVAPEGRKFPGAGTHRGRDAVREKFVDEVQSGFPTFGYRPAQYLETDEEQWVVTLGDFVGEGRSGEFDVPAAVVWEFDRETVTRVRIHSDSDAFPERVREEDKEQQEPDREDSEEQRRDADQPQAREGEDR